MYKRRFRKMKVIVRDEKAGVYYGKIESRDGVHFVMKDTRWLWFIDGSATLAELAMYGTSQPMMCKFSCVVDRMELFNVVQVLETTAEARKSIESVPVWLTR